MCALCGGKGHIRVFGPRPLPSLADPWPELPFKDYCIDCYDKIEKEKSDELRQ